MPSKRQVKERTKALLRRWGPRIIALYWVKWATQTAVAYLDLVPKQLAWVDSFTPIPLWSWWAACAVLLFLGAIVPPCAGPKAQDIARYLRVAGVGLIALALCVWTIVFYAEQPRGWVSGKNYELIFLAAAASAWALGRNQVGGKQVKP